jgi:hypothetical protein
MDMAAGPLLKGAWNRRRPPRGAGPRTGGGRAERPGRRHRRKEMP